MRQMLHWPHWRVFLYTMSVPLAFFFIGLLGFTSQFPIGDLLVLQDDIYTTVLLAFFGLLLSMWEWTVGHALFYRLPPGMTMNLSLFRASVLIPVVYNLVHVVMVGFDVNRFETMNVFASMNCVVALFTLYSVHFMAKALNAVEKGKPARFGEYVASFIMLLVLFLGIWFIQPRVNRIFSDEEGIEQHLIG